jgi:hypothetical protein
MATVYKIQNTKTGDCYIGSSFYDPFGRWISHIADLRMHRHHTKEFQEVWNNSKFEDWQFSILEVVEEDLRLGREQHWYDTLHPSLNGTDNIARAASKRYMLERVNSMLARGSTYREIAKECGCSLGWITQHRRRLAQTT